MEHEGHAFDLGVQIQVFDKKRLTSFDIPGSERPAHKSTRLRSATENSERIASQSVLSNSSNDILFVSMTTRSGDFAEESQLEIGANETLFIKLSGKGRANSGSLFVNLKAEDGAPGDLTGGLLWQDLNRGISGFNPLEDPAMRETSRLTTTAVFGANKSGFAHPLLLQNATSERVEVNGILLITRGDREVWNEEFSEKLDPFEGRVIELRSWIKKAGNQVDYATLDLAWEGPADGLVAVLHSLDPERGDPIVNPLVDPAQERKKVSNYIVRLGQGFNTEIQIKNPTDKPRQVVAHLFLEGGKEYDFGVVEIAAHNLYRIDLGALQVQQTTDRSGDYLPESDELVKGQFIWFPFKGPRNLVGRAVISNKRLRTASSFSCQQCGTFIPDHILIQITPTLDLPAGTLLPSNDSETTGKIVYKECGNFSNTFGVTQDPDYYTSSDTSVATVDSTGKITAHSPGTSVIRGHATIERELCVLATCETEPFTVETVVSSEVVTVCHLQIDKPFADTIFTLNQSDVRIVDVPLKAISTCNSLRVNWNINWKYTTTGGRGPWTRTAALTSTVGQTINLSTYEDGGKATITATIDANGNSINDQVVVYVVGDQIPNPAITTYLDAIYSGPTTRLFTGIAMRESSYRQFATATIFGRSAKWPLESDEENPGSHIGLMMTETSMQRAFDWHTNANAAASLFQEKIMISNNREQTFRNLNPGLRALTDAETELNALLLYGPESGGLSRMYYVPNAAGTDWLVNNGGNRAGINYVTNVLNLVQ